MVHNAIVSAQTRRFEEEEIQNTQSDQPTKSPVGQEMSEKNAQGVKKEPFSFGAIISGQIPMTAGPNTSNLATNDYNPSSASGGNKAGFYPQGTRQKNEELGGVLSGNVTRVSTRASFRTTVRHLPGPKTPIHDSLAAYEPSFGCASRTGNGSSTVPAGTSANSYSYLDYPRVKRARQLDLGVDEGGFLSPSQQSLQSTGSNVNANNATNAKGGAPRRGKYKCSKCGQPKKGHICPFANTKGKGKQAQSMAGLAGTSGSALSPGSSQMLGSGPLGGDPNFANYNKMRASAVCQPSISQSFMQGGTSTPVAQRVKGKKQLSLSPGTPLNSVTHNSQAFLTPQKVTFTIAQGTRIEYRSPRQVTGTTEIPCALRDTEEGSYLASNVVMDEWLSRVFAQLDPASLLNVSQVCRHWHKVASYVWNYVTDIKLEIDTHAGEKTKLPKVVLKHAHKLISLRLHVTTCIDDEVIYDLASVGSNTLKTLEVTLDSKAKNLINNGSLQALLKKCKSLKCLNIGGRKLIIDQHDQQ